jgi:hypothetical protein
MAKTKSKQEGAANSDPSEFQIPADYKIETVVARGKQAERVPQQ